MVHVAQMKNKQELKQKVYEAVQDLYCAVSESPHTAFHFPTGKSAMLAVGYPKDMTESLPQSAHEAFAGVGFHFQNKAIREGDSVLDVGSGSGSDLLLAAKLAGAKGEAIGIDITSAMIEKAQKAARETGITNVTLQQGSAEDIPFPNEYFDVVISNGVLNLIPDKQQAFSELYRVLKPGGKLSISDIALGNPISDESRENPRLWAECIVGAMLEDEYVALIEKAGFKNVQVAERLDYFALSAFENTREVAQDYRAHSITLSASK